MFLKRGNALDFVITLVIASDTTLIEYLFQDIQYSNIYFIILLFVFFLAGGENCIFTANWKTLLK